MSVGLGRGRVRVWVLAGLTGLGAASCGDDDDGSAQATGGRGATGGAAGDAGSSGNGGSETGGAPAGGSGEPVGTGGAAGQTGAGAASGANEGGAGGEGETASTLPQCAAAPLDRTVPSSLFEMARCLFEGADPPQRGVKAGAISAERVVVLRGRVLDANGKPFAGVTVAVLGHPEFGYTESRADGYFDLAANGGGQLTLRYDLDGYLPARRHLPTAWRQFVVFPDVVILPIAAEATPVELDGASVNVVEGAAVSDASGSRQEVLILTPNTEASLVLANGTKKPLSWLHVRVQEVTVGERGSLAMPADLPANSGYTYAVAYTVDEATEAGASRVEFSPPVVSYVENFLEFPAGTVVPNGFYDPDTDIWKPAASGVVLDIVAITSGSAQVDSDGDGRADSAATLDALGIGADELRVLGSRYAAGQSLWRTLTPHFSFWDKNWSLSPPEGASDPDGEMSGGEDGGCQTNEQGSIIGCEHQTLGEVLPISGTPFALRYQSERMTGRADVRQVRLRLSGDSVPEPLKRIDVEVSVAGQLLKKSYAPEVNLSDTFEWNGKDAHGRLLQGKQPLVARIGYVYDASYQETDVFGYNGNGVEITGNDARSELTFWQNLQGRVGTVLTKPLGLGGWTLDQNHVLDLAGQTLFLGTGEQRTSRATGSADLITTVVGSGDPSLPARGDGGPANLAYVRKPGSVVVAPDGTLFVAEDHFVRKVSPDGTISTYAGKGIGSVPSGDGGPATEAILPSPVRLALASDGTLYLAGYYQVRAVSPDGTIRTAAGSGALYASGDGGPALEAGTDPSALAVGPDGSLFIGEFQEYVVRRVGPDGIITRFAGNGDTEEGVRPPTGEGGPALAAPIGAVSGLAVNAIGEVFIATVHPDLLRKVDQTGVITTVAGVGDGPAPANGVSARGIGLLYPAAPSVGLDGSLFFSASPRTVLQARPNGLIHVVVDENPVGANGDIGDQGPAALGYLNGIPDATAVGPDGSLYIGDTQGDRVRRVGPAFPGFSATDTVVPSSDARQVYVFDAAGRHLRTLDALTKAKLLEFSYDEQGLMTGATDQFGNTTSFKRDASGLLRSVTGPDGETTEFTPDSNGYLASTTNANQETTTFTYSSQGLLESITSPRGPSDEHSFTYDDVGRLTSDNEASGSSKKLRRTEAADGSFSVALSTRLGRTKTFDVRERDANSVERTLTDAAGLVSTWRIDAGQAFRATPTRSTTTVFGGDPRFGIQAPVIKSQVIQLAGAGAPKQTLEETRAVTLSDRNDPLSVSSFERTLLVNGQPWRETWSTADATVTTTSPEGRQVVGAFDDKGSLRSLKMGQLAPLSLDYDAAGKLSAVSTGDRTTRFEYDAGYVSVHEDALGRRSTFERDAVGRQLAVTLPDDSVLATTFDANGNLTGVTPPGQPEHGLNFGAGNLLASYDPPKTSTVPKPSTAYAYDQDDQLKTITFPGGGSIVYQYEGKSGRLASFNENGRITRLTYDPSSGQLATLQGGDVTLGFAYTGDILTRTTWSGAVAGSVSRVLDAFFRTSSESVGTSPIAFSYDNDGFLVGAGAETFTRDAKSGLLTGTTLGTVTDGLGYNNQGELLTYTASAGSNVVYGVTLTRDRLGRIATRAESMQGTSHTDEFSYDSRGRLVSVVRDAAVIGSYGYDANDNRTSASDGNGARTASFDAQDRQLSDGATTFTFTPEGALLTKKSGSSLTSYDYDLLGALRSVTLPDSKLIEYLLDGNHRRIARKVNGTVTAFYLYRDNLAIAAELDAAGAVRSRFVYADRVNVPDQMQRDGKSYRLITDERGSVRLVIDTASGAVAQRMDYDAWGNVTSDTNPGFQPFGFAGGLYDADTGFVRFGARDYDAGTGRWTAKDPIGFGGGQSNLYGYVDGDPTNGTDLTGTTGLAGVAAGAISGGIGGFISGGASGAAAGALIGGVVGVVNPWASNAAGAAAGAAVASILGQIAGNLSSGNPWSNINGWAVGGAAAGAGIFWGVGAPGAAGGICGELGLAAGEGVSVGLGEGAGMTVK